MRKTREQCKKNTIDSLVSIGLSVRSKLFTVWKWPREKKSPKHATKKAPWNDKEESSISEHGEKHASEEKGERTPIKPCDDETRKKLNLNWFIRIDFVSYSREKQKRKKKGKIHTINNCLCSRFLCVRWTDVHTKKRKFFKFYRAPMKTKTWERNWNSTSNKMNRYEIEERNTLTRSVSTLVLCLWFCFELREYCKEKRNQQHNEKNNNNEIIQNTVRIRESKGLIFEGFLNELVDITIAPRIAGGRRTRL